MQNLKGMTIKRIITIATTLSVAILISSCCACHRYEKLYGKPLEQTVWTVAQMNGAAMRPQSGTFNIVLDTKGHMSGVGACNTLGADYTISFDEGSENRSGKISFAPIASTRMACPDQQQEQQFTEVLQSIDAFSREGATLYLFANSELVLVMEFRE